MSDLGQSNNTVVKVTPYGLSHFQKEALDTLTLKACEYDIWYFQAKFDLVLDKNHADWGHQIQISFLNTDARLWLNGGCFTAEDKFGDREVHEVEDYSNDQAKLLKVFVSWLDRILEPIL